MIALFRASGITGWRRNHKLTGKPDFVFRNERIAVFVDGCFWHGCPKPKHASLPKTRTEWWAAKLERNKARDRKVNLALRKANWRVLRVWEYDLTAKNAPRVIRRIRRALAGMPAPPGSDRPTTASNCPTTTPDCPTTTLDCPTTTSDRPTTTLDCPTTTPDRPTTMAKRANPARERPTTAFLCHHPLKISQNGSR